MLSAALFASLAASAVLAAPVPAPAVVNATHNATAYYYYQNGNAGACGTRVGDSAIVVGLPLEFYSNYDAVSPFCGDYVVVQGKNKNITARVNDASTLNSTMTFSIGAWDALNATATDLTTVQWRFANATEAAAAAKEAEQVSTSSVAAPSSTRSAAAKVPISSSSSTSSWVAPSSTSSWVAPSSTSSWVAPSSSSTKAAESSSWTKSSSSSEWVAPSSSAKSSSTWTPSSSSAAWTSSSSSAAWTSSSEWHAPSSTSEWHAPSSSSTSQWVAPTTTTTPWVAPTTTTTAKPWTPTTTQAQAAQTQAASNANSGGYSGQATFYTQGGNAGSCGVYNSDSAYIVAVNQAQMNSGWCGKTVSITNTANGKTITATVADTCPGCSYGSLDLSTGAFGALGSYSQGVLPIRWNFS